MLALILLKSGSVLVGALEKDMSEPSVAADPNIWILREEILLASFISKFGQKKWDKIASAMNTFVDPEHKSRPIGFFTEETCRDAFVRLMTALPSSKRRRHASNETLIMDSIAGEAVFSDDAIKRLMKTLELKRTAECSRVTSALKYERSTSADSEKSSVRSGASCNTDAHDISDVGDENEEETADNQRRVAAMNGNDAASQSTTAGSGALMIDETFHASELITSGAESVDSVSGVIVPQRLMSTPLTVQQSASVIIANVLPTRFAKPPNTAISTATANVTAWLQREQFRSSEAVESSEECFNTNPACYAVPPRASHTSDKVVHGEQQYTRYTLPLQQNGGKHHQRTQLISPPTHVALKENSKNAEAISADPERVEEVALVRLGFAEVENGGMAVTNLVGLPTIPVSKSVVWEPRNEDMDEDENFPPDFALYLDSPSGSPVVSMIQDNSTMRDTNVHFALYLDSPSGSPAVSMVQDNSTMHDTNVQHGSASVIDNNAERPISARSRLPPTNFLEDSSLVGSALKPSRLETVCSLNYAFFTGPRAFADTDVLPSERTKCSTTAHASQHQTDSDVNAHDIPRSNTRYTYVDRSTPLLVSLPVTMASAEVPPVDTDHLFHFTAFGQQAISGNAHLSQPSTNGYSIARSDVGDGKTNALLVCQRCKRDSVTTTSFHGLAALRSHYINAHKYRMNVADCVDRLQMGCLTQRDLERCQECSIGVAMDIQHFTHHLCNNHRAQERFICFAEFEKIVSNHTHPL